MSQNFDFKKRFGKEITKEEVINSFITQINHSLIPALDEISGNYYSRAEDSLHYSSDGSRFFDYVCLNFGLEPSVIISNFNRDPYSIHGDAIPSFKEITKSNFEHTLLLIEIVYAYFKQRRDYNSSELIDFINELVNRAILQPVSLGVFWRDGHFYPEGAVELDEKLIREPLDWLSSYSKVRELYQNSLDNYSQSNTNGIKRKDACINAYQAVEEIAKKVVGEEKPFDSLFGSFAQSIGLNSYWQKILNQYREFSKEYGRHPGTKDEFIPDKPSTEAFIYLSGLLLRLSVQKLDDYKK